MSARRIRVALDWTPNANHIGFFVALERGYYDKENLEVTLLSPDEDDYTITPGRKVARGDADVCLAPSESAISFASAASKPRLKAVAAVLQHDTSAIAVLESREDIQRPRDLAGKQYASYDGRFEMDVVKALIADDGGDGEAVKEVQPPKLKIWQEFLDGKHDATWIFKAHEGVLAQRAGVALRLFELTDYDIPYGYSPILLAHPDLLSGEGGEALKRFLKATAAGYCEALRDPEAAAACLPAVQAGADASFYVEGIRVLAPHVLHERRKSWGLMDRDLWAQFVGWMHSKMGLIQDRYGNTYEIDSDSLWTNDFLAGDA